MTKTGIITQARMQSTRLPGKILKVAAGKTLLEWHINRLLQSGYPVVVATTVLEADQPIVDWCEANQVPYFRGDEANVLSRYEGAATRYGFDTIVRVTSDCPLIDGEVVRAGIETWKQIGKANTYLSNTLARTWPRGFDFEVFSREALHDAFIHADSDGQKEHVTPYIWRDNTDKFDIRQQARPTNASQYRLTVDTPEDFQLISTLLVDYNAGNLNDEAIIQIMETHPELNEINAEIEQKKTQN